MLTRAAHPELIVHQRAPRHHTCGEFSITVGAYLTPVLVRGGKLLEAHLVQFYTDSYRRVSACMYKEVYRKYKEEYGPIHESLYKIRER